jgi:RNA polymerase-binding transcription factor DksA
VSRGFRNADETQAMADKAVADQIERILEEGRDENAIPSDGRCVDCGQEIGQERLAALPMATRCIRCQAEWEQGPGRR